MTLEFFTALAFTFTIVPSGFNKVRYSSPLSMFFSLSIVCSVVVSEYHKKGNSKVDPRIRRMRLLLNFLLFSSGFAILFKTVKQNY